MTITFAFFTFLNAFWIMAFIAAPFSVHYAPNQTAAAPESINWKKLVLIAASLAFLVTGLLALVIKSGIIQVK